MPAKPRRDARICLLTPGQPSTNPRLVKEADALIEAGYAVDVLCGHWIPWASRADQDLRDARRWTPTYVEPAYGPRRTWSRLRHAMARRALTLAPRSRTLQEHAVARATPDLRRAAVARRADLYIAHNLGALPAAAAAAAAHGARLGFDAEDFHTGERPHGAAATPVDAAVEAVERRYLPRCSYTTAASEGIADAYAEKYGIPRPAPILNVFPRIHRPPSFRDGQPQAPMTLYWFSQTVGPDRGLEDVIDALGLLADLPIELHLRGIWQPGYRAALLDRGRRKGVDERRIVSHEAASPDEMVRLAARYDVGLAVEQPVSRNREICLTNKIFTYLLAGNAIAGTATAGQRPVLMQVSDAAFAYAPGDAAALAAGLRLWALDRNRLLAARRASWERGEREFSWEREQRRFLELVDLTLNRSPAPMRAVV